MPSVKTAAIISDRVQRGGRRMLRYSITLTDDLGVDHTSTVGPKIVDADFDADADLVTAGDKVLSKQVAGEQSQYLEAVREGDNLFQTQDPQWNPRDTLLLSVLSEALTLPATDPLVINGIAFLALVTDEELVALFGFTQEQVDGVRATAVQLTDAKAVLAGYVPVLGGE